MRVQKATKPSASIIVSLRFQRSINTPANGPIKACGRSAAMAENAKTSADPVLRLSQIMMAKLTAELLMSETNCPVHNIANFFFQFSCINVVMDDAKIIK